MPSLAAQIVDQRIAGVLGKHAVAFREELGLHDEGQQRSAAIVFLVAKALLELSDEDALDGIVDGPDDFGVDGLYFTPPQDEQMQVWMIQAKYRQDLKDTAFPENDVAKLVDAVDVLLDPNADVRVNQRLEVRLAEVHSLLMDAIPQVHMIAASNGSTWGAAAQGRIDRSTKTTGSQVTWRFFGPDEVVSALQVGKPVQADLHLTGRGVLAEFDFRRAIIGRIAVEELAQLIQKHGNALFERNIRRYLGRSGNRVNEDIEATLRRPEERPNFYFYNNGITITCSKFAHNALREDWHVKLSDMQIVNGGQTARTIEQVAKAGVDLAGAEVLVRIYELAQDNDAGFVDAITLATNSQSPVELSDLKANDQRQKMLAELIAGLGYAYRAKREAQPVGESEFTSTAVAEAVLAVWRHRPHQARLGGWALFGALYDEIFRPDLNGAQAVTAALLLRLAERRRKRPPPDAPDFLTYGFRHIAMLMGRQLLEDVGVPLASLDHRCFKQARQLIEKQSDRYMRRAENTIASEVAEVSRVQERWSLGHGHPRRIRLQRLAAAFRDGNLAAHLATVQMQDR